MNDVSVDTIKGMVEWATTSKKELQEIVLKFCQDNNRPFSLNEIHERCAKSESKSAVQKVIDSLVSREKIVEKQFGKQKIYFLRQNDDDEGADTDELDQLERKVDSLQKSWKEKEDRIKTLELEIKQLSSKPSLIELEIEQDECKIKVLSLTEELKMAKSSLDLSPSRIEHDIEKINEKYAKVLAEYRKRKRICNNMIDSILEGYPKTKKHLLEEIGVETDEMVLHIQTCF